MIVKEKQKQHLCNRIIVVAQSSTNLVNFHASLDQRKHLSPLKDSNFLLWVAFMIALSWQNGCLPTLNVFTVQVCMKHLL